MNGSANVNSIQAIADVKAALAVFVDQANGSLEEVDLQIRKVLDWVLNDQPKYWQRQIREREERVTQAKVDLHRCRSMKVSKDHTPDCAEQKVALRKAQLQLEEAHEKLKVTREWGRQLPTLIDEYLSQAQQLGAYLMDDLDRAGATLERMTQALESYVSVAPSPGQPESVGWGSAESTPQPAPEEPARETSSNSTGLSSEASSGGEI
jgi:hypothetical protein